MVRQESSCLQLERDARRSVSDDDHGLMQLTNPKPTSNQVYAGTKCIAGGVAPLDHKTVQERTHWNKRFQNLGIATTIGKTTRIRKRPSWRGGSARDLRPRTRGRQAGIHLKTGLKSRIVSLGYSDLNSHVLATHRAGGAIQETIPARTTIRDGSLQFGDHWTAVVVWTGKSDFPGGERGLQSR